MSKSELTPARYLGKICDKHPELAGLRKKANRSCVGCWREQIKKSHSTEEFKVKAREYSKTEARRESHSTWMVEYYKQNPHIPRQYKLARLNRTPAWANQSKIAEIYQEARKLGLTVDHIIPLCGKLVSGLHVENNLQLLPGPTNFSKGNSYVS